jgi:hypothetical protein
MTKKPDELFLLIKSLDKNEKGYFRKFCRIYSSSEEGNYLRLFDCMGKMEYYDETHVRQKFAGEKFLSQLPVTKHYLKNLIIRALRNYYEDQVPQIGRLASFIDAVVMLKKGLTDSAHKRVQKELPAAVNAERFIEVFLWLDFMQTLHVQTGGVMGQNDRALEYYNLRTKTADQYKNIAGYEYLTTQAMDLDVFRGDPSRKKTDQLLANPLLKSPDAALSGKARLMYANVLSKIYRSVEELKKARTVLYEFISYYEAGNKTISLSAGNHFVLYNELLNSMTRDAAHEMESVIARAKTLLIQRRKDLSEPEKQLAESCLTEHEVYLFLYKKEPLKALSAIENSVALNQDLRHSCLAQMSVSFLESWAHLQLKDFSKALDSINRILNSNYEEYTFLMQEAYLLNILIHLELDSFSIMKRQFVLAENFVKKYAHNYHINLHILSALKEIWKHVERGNKPALKKSAAGLISYLKNENAVQNAYLEIWLESKLNL